MGAVGVVLAKQVGQLKDSNGAVKGFRLLEIAQGKHYDLDSAMIIKFMQAKKLEVQNLKVVTVNGQNILVDQEMLNSLVNKARREYEQGNSEIMSNKDYDSAYDKLSDLEEKSGYIAKDSATRNVGYEVVQELPKKKHSHKMLSLDKTKSVDTLRAMLGKMQGVLSWKEDGITIVLTYENGKLIEGVTRGNGEIGEVVTPNVKQFKNVPIEIPFKGKLIVRGEALISYRDFEAINGKMPADKQFKNPRNLCSGSVRQLDSKVTAQRNVMFKAFDLVEAEQLDSHNSYSYQLRWLKRQGFDVVEHLVVDAATIERAVAKFQSSIDKNPVPSDGLVLKLDDLAYGERLGTTQKFPRHSLAFKWADDEAETTLKEIEWSPSRTGLINPVAVFEPVELEGTTVTRASVHNVQILLKLGLVPGSKIMVYKANMIIPQISRNLTPSNSVNIPKECPCCGEPTRVNKDTVSGVLTLMCDNPDCAVKGNKKFEHFVQRDAMNIDGISGSKLQKLKELGLIDRFADIFHISEHEDEIVNTPGFGYKSYQNMVNAVEKSRKVRVANLIYALGIDNIGLSTSKLIAKKCGYDIRKMVNLTLDQLLSFEGIGYVLADSYTSWFNDDYNRGEFLELLKEVEIIPETVSTNTELSSISIAVHGSLYKIKRTALKELVEQLGGKLVSQVSKQTTYLVTNQPEDNTNKVRDAKKNGVEIISEDAFIAKFNLKV